MAAVSRVTAKGYFETGDQPTQAEFVDLIDSTKFEGDDLGTTTPAKVHSSELCAKATAPSASADAGVEGEVRVAAGFIYVYSGGSWKRAAIATW